MKQLGGKYLIAIAICTMVLLLAMIPEREHPDAYHTVEEWDRFVSERLMHAPPDTNHIFPTARRCQGCHGYDPQMNAMVDFMGNDVNMHDDWSTSMMANAARDPFWRAKVSHEVLSNPMHKMDLETKCTSCHAPQGHFTALLRGADHYSITEMAADTIAMDGVSCGACHMKSEKDLDKLFSGEANYDTSRVMYGPYEMPFAAPMNDFVGFNPVYSEHINDAGVCASCHTLLTSSVDLEGNYTGNKFVEQATYHEWINSDFDDEGATPQTCQGCHMPRLEEEIVISANYLFLDGRAPYGLHDMVGANTTMIQMIKNNKKALNVTAADEHFDETIAKTLDMLQQRSVETALNHLATESDTAYFSLRIENKAGHKFPSGFPSRRVFVEFEVIDENGMTIFHSGATDEHHEIIGLGDELLPHYNTITDDGKAQIYEFVLADVNGDFTTILERADGSLKDNRLPPRGFSTSHSAYDTTKVYGAALTDPDFNYDGTQEGSGADVIHYNVPLGGYTGLIDIRSRIYYQAISPRWAEALFQISSPEINAFKGMYDNADLTPVVVAEDVISDLMIDELAVADLSDLQLTVSPNPTSDGWVGISTNVTVYAVDIYDRNGTQISTSFHSDRILLPQGSGIYFLRCQTDQGVHILKVARL